MSIWVKKLFVAVITVVTLGFYVPPIDIDTSNESDNKEIESEKKQVEENTVEIVYADPSLNVESAYDPLGDLVDHAKAQTLQKLGPRITAQLDREVTTEILPEMEQVITDILVKMDYENLTYVELIETATPGYGENIFDLYDVINDQVVAKFHVRRDNRPQEGYWFNFHYHEALDNFEVHHEIGEVYWSKNTPPKWMS